MQSNEILLSNTEPNFCFCAFRRVDLHKNTKKRINPEIVVLWFFLFLLIICTEWLGSIKMSYLSYSTKKNGM